MIFSGAYINKLSADQTDEYQEDKVAQDIFPYDLDFYNFMIVYFALPSASVEIVWLASIPVSYFLTHYFVFVKKKLVPDILFSLLFVFILLIQIWHLK